MIENQCPVCSANAITRRPPADYTEHVCENCGRYQLSGSASPLLNDLPYDNLPKDAKRIHALLSHYIWIAQGEPNWISICTDDIENCAQMNFPTLNERIDLLIRYMGETLGDSISGKVDTEEDNLRAKIAAFERSDVSYVISAGIDKGYIMDPSAGRLRLTPLGWDHFKKLTVPTSPIPMHTKGLNMSISGATIVNVMIASPGDVQEERSIAEEIINQWNSDNSESAGVVFLVKRWEKHVSPSTLLDAQLHINKTILDKCDFLVGIFWARIGTATSDYPSGTIEELTKHSHSGKEGMVYFSQKNPPYEHDPEQFAALKKFKEGCKFLSGSYNSLDDFKLKFTNDFARTARANFCSPTSMNPLSSTRENRSSHGLSVDATALILDALNDPKGTIQVVETRAGLSVLTNGIEHNIAGTPRSAASCRAAVEALVNAGFVHDISQTGEIFRVTVEGYNLQKEMSAARKTFLSDRPTAIFLDSESS